MKKQHVPPSKPNWTLIAILGGGVALIALVWMLATSGPDLDPFAQCLTDKGAVMYGAYWCPHCAEQKRMFGSSFEHVEYVECATGGPRNIPAQPGLCKEKEIASYPTWIFADGGRMTGTQQLSALAARAGCKEFLAN